MIRIVTLHDSYTKLGTPSRLQEMTEQLREAEVDILCCQGMQRTTDGRKEPVRNIAEALQMTYSFSATGCQVHNHGEEEEIVINGLSILAGSHVWMLNSGSFPLLGGEPGKKYLAQFAVLRQNGNLLLVINTELSPLPSVRQEQLQALFSHQILHEGYGAIVLCSNGNIAVSKQEMQFDTAFSSYTLADETRGGSFCREQAPAPLAVAPSPSTADALIDGVIFTLTARGGSSTIVKIHGTPAALHTALLPATEFEFRRIPPEKKNKFFFPLSFAEQRLESKEGYRGLAASML